MKGIVFTELIEMVESDLGIDIADQMIAQANVSNEGAYTAVGTYDHAELVRMIVCLSEATSIPIPELIKTFGRHLFSQFSRLYPQFFEGIDSALGFLPRVETYIHVEVRKLYPDAELPSFDCTMVGSTLELTYQSKRPFADLAEGLILASVDFFGDNLHVSRTDLGAQDGTQALFELTPIQTNVGDLETKECPA